MTSDPTQHLWWLASRASGIVALALLTGSVLLGLILGGRLMRGLPAWLGNRVGAQPRLISKSHEQLSLAALLMIGVHGVTLLGDAYLRPTLTQIIVPLTIGYKPAAVGAGIVGGHVATVLGLSFYWRNRIGAQTWRKLHRASVLAYVLSVAHTLGAGTDASSSWLRTPVLASAGFATLLLMARIARSFPKIGKSRAAVEHTAKA